MDIRLIVGQMAVLFILIAVGFLAGKIKMLTRDGTKTLSKVVLNISTPCTILNSVMGETGRITGGSAMGFLLLVLLAYVLFFVIAIPLARALGAAKRPKPESGIRNLVSGDSSRWLYCAMMVFGNVGFMGFPVSQALFGPESTFYVAIFNTLFQLILFSLGIIMISGKSGNISIRVLINAAFFSSLLSFAIVFTGFRPPGIIADTVRLTSGLNSPCAMLVIGATLSRVSVKDVFSKWRLYPISVVKLLVMPVITWLIFKNFVTDSFLLGILVLLSGMPMAASLPIIAIEYGGDESSASGGIFLSTLISAATVPLIAYLFIS